MADIKFHCPHCTQKIGVPEEGAGRYLKCPTCEKQIQIPAAQSPEAVKPVPVAPISPKPKPLAPKPASPTDSTIKLSPPKPSAAPSPDVKPPSPKPADAPATKPAAPAPKAAPSATKEAKAGGAKKWNLPKSGAVKRTRSPGASKKNECPECGAELGSGAVMCTACGFNVKTGKKMETNL